MFKIIVAGGREFDNYELLKNELDRRTLEIQDVEIVSGTARGADSLGERYALENGLKIKRFPADWDRFGKRAGYIRNAEMAKYADACICFWDGKSRGTKHMIDLAKRYGIELVVVQY